MSAQRLLEGEVVPNVDPELEALRAEVRMLRRDVSDAKLEATRAREDADRALSALRKQLSPLYRALQMVFGELDAAGVRDEAPTAPASAGPTVADARQSAVWNVWKSKLGATAAQVIEALQTHGELNTQQLAIATGLHRTTVPKGIYELNKAGLISKVGGRFSLKQL